MHYKNGREAKVGDQVVVRSYNGIFSGIVIKQLANCDTCNLYLVPIEPTKIYCVTAKDCLHIDDALPPADAK